MLGAEGELGSCRQLFGRVSLEGVDVLESDSLGVRQT